MDISQKVDVVGKGVGSVYERQHLMACQQVLDFGRGNLLCSTN